MRIHRLCCILLCFAALQSLAQDGLVHTWHFLPGDFTLVIDRRASAICVDLYDYKVVQIAAGMLADDVERVSGARPAVMHEIKPADRLVFVGTLGKSTTITALARSGKLDLTPIQGKWESFIIVTVTNPVPGVESGLVIAGRDRRRTPYAAFTLSQAIGSSP